MIGISNQSFTDTTCNIIEFLKRSIQYAVQHSYYIVLIYYTPGETSSGQIFMIASSIVWYNVIIKILSVEQYRIVGNFRGRKLSQISRFFSHLRKFSPRNSMHAIPIMQPVLTFRESFLREMLLSYRSAKVFSLENFPLYGNNLYNMTDASLHAQFQQPDRRPSVVGRCTYLCDKQPQTHNCIIV